MPGGYVVSIHVAPDIATLFLQVRGLYEVTDFAFVAGVPYDAHHTAAKSSLTRPG